MVEEMYLEETKDRAAAAGNEEGRSGGGGKSSNNVDDNGDDATPSRLDSEAAAKGVHGPSMLELAGDQHAGLYGDDGEDGADAMHRRLKKARADEPATTFHHHAVHDMAALHAQAAAAARQQQQHHEEVSHRELLMKFMESGGGAGTRDHHQQHDNGGYSLFAHQAAPYGHQFTSDQPFAFASGNGGVSLTLGLPHGAGDQTASFLMGSSAAAGDSASHGGGAAGGYDMTNMQSTKSFAAQLMRDFVA
jgi:hypothetical protein